MDEKILQRLNEIRQEVEGCQKCGLCQGRTHTVFGRGNGRDILFVGEAPGENEDLEGEPFVGAAGKLLDLYLEYAGFSDEDFYIANILKCRPPKNRNPLPEEEEACLPFLREQLRTINPKILVCLGRVAACRILSPDFRITKQRGIWYDLGGMRVMATYHPSALLRDPEKKKTALLDFKEIRKEWEKLT